MACVWPGARMRQLVVEMSVWVGAERVGTKPLITVSGISEASHEGLARNSVEHADQFLPPNNNPLCPRLQSSWPWVRENFVALSQPDSHKGTELCQTVTSATWHTSSQMTRVFWSIVSSPPYHHYHHHHTNHHHHHSPYPPSELRGKGRLHWWDHYKKALMQMSPSGLDLADVTGVRVLTTRIAWL